MALEGKSSKRVVNSKVIIAGPASVGKTCLLERYVNDHFMADDPSHGPTLGCDWLSKTVDVDSTKVKMFLYDTAGQERFADLISSYYRIADVCLLCFALNEPHTFDHTQIWMKKVLEHNSKCTFILVGTKADVAEGIDTSAFSRWADDNNMPFILTSALTGGAAIKSVFETVVADKCISAGIERQQKNPRSQGVALLPCGLSGNSRCCAF